MNSVRSPSARCSQPGLLDGCFPSRCVETSVYRIRSPVLCFLLSSDDTISRAAPRHSILPSREYCGPRSERCVFTRARSRRKEPPYRYRSADNYLFRRIHGFLIPISAVVVTCCTYLADCGSQLISDFKQRLMHGTNVTQ